MMMRWNRVFAFSAFAIGASWMALAAAPVTGKAEGTLKIAGKSYKIAYAYATGQPNAFDEKKKDVVIFLTDEPIAAGYVEDEWGGHRLSNEGKVHGMCVSVDDQKQPYSAVVFGLGQMSGNALFSFDPQTWDGKQAVGRFHTEGEKESFDQKYSFDITFSALIGAGAAAKAAQAAATGKALPADGGAPGKAYMLYCKAMAGDLAALRKLVTKERAKQMDDPEFPKMFEMMKEMRVKDAKIVRGSLNGATAATLTVTGTDPMGGGASEGTVQMVLEDSQWKVEKESWKSTMK